MYSFKTNDTIDRLTLVLLNVPILYATIRGGARGGVSQKGAASAVYTVTNISSKGILQCFNNTSMQTGSVPTMKW